MSIFGSILDRIFHHGTAGSAQAATPQQSGTVSGQGRAPSQQSQAPSAATAAGTQRLQSVDVEAVLVQLAAKKGGGGNWTAAVGMAIAGNCRLFAPVGRAGST